jgi:hypothetical protein
MNKTVFIIGAGASFGFGLPTGPQLNDCIAQSLKITVNDWGEAKWADDHIDHAFRNWSDIGLNDLWEASKVIVGGITYHPSPDDFLFAFGQQNAVVSAGKAAIVASILNRERGSWLSALGHHDQKIADAALLEKRSSWPLQLIGFLSPGVRACEPERLFEDVAFVNFNYDRCLEHILCHALCRTHRLSFEHAAAVVKGIEIIHPYGRIGPLPWEETSGSVEFGSQYFGRLEKLAANIHTLTESHHTDDERQLLTRTMDSADAYVFLGFGFHKQNMNLLSCSARLDPKRPPVFSTAFKTSHEQRAVFAERIRNALRLRSQDSVSLSELECDGFLSEYGIRFSR